MLILSRKLGQRIVIGSDLDMSKNVVIEVVFLGTGTVKLGITGPDDTTIHREEIYDRVIRRPGGES